MTTKKNSDVETIVSAPEKLTLLDGTEVEIQRLKTRQTFALMRVLTSGMKGSIGSLLFGEDTNEEEFAATLLGAMLVSIPEAQEETIAFIKTMVSPANLIENPISKPEKESNLEAFERLYRSLDNPELEDLVDIVERVITIESPHIKALGKRLAVLFKVKSLSDTAKLSASSKNDSKS